MHIVLIQDNLVILVDDLEPLLLALIRTNNCKLPWVLVSSNHLFGLVNEVNALVVGPTRVSCSIVVTISTKQ